MKPGRLFFLGHQKSGTKEYERVIGEYFKKKLNPLISINPTGKQWVLATSVRRGAPKMEEVTQLGWFPLQCLIYEVVDSYRCRVWDTGTCKKGTYSPAKAKRHTQPT